MPWRPEKQECVRAAGRRDLLRGAALVAGIHEVAGALEARGIFP